MNTLPCWVSRDLDRYAWEQGRDDAREAFIEAEAERIAQDAGQLRQLIDDENDSSLYDRCVDTAVRAVQAWDTIETLASHGPLPEDLRAMLTGLYRAQRGLSDDLGRLVRRAAEAVADGIDNGGAWTDGEEWLP